MACNSTTDPDCVTFNWLSYAIPLTQADITQNVPGILLMIGSTLRKNIPYTIATYISTEQELNNIVQKKIPSTQLNFLQSGSNTITKPNHNITINWTGQVDSSSQPFTVTNNGIPVPNYNASSTLSHFPTFFNNIPLPIRSLSDVPSQRPILTPIPTVTPTPTPTSTVTPRRGRFNYLWLILLGVVLIIVIVIIIIWLLRK